MMISVGERINSESGALVRMLAEFGMKLRVAMPGIVVSFDSTKQTVRVKPVLRERVNIDGVLSDEEIKDLLDVPIFMPRAGGFTLTMPVTAGDECLVIFGDSCMDSWWQSGGTGNKQMDLRRHDLSDGYAILGVWSQPRKIANYSIGVAQLRNDSGTTILEVSNGKVTARSAEVALAGDWDDFDVRRLIDERLKIVFDEHIHAPGTSPNTGPPVVPLNLNDISTARTKAG
jgi:hypothetical protein